MSNERDIMEEQFDFLMRHDVACSGGPACRLCCRLEALKLVLFVPFDMKLFTKREQAKRART